MQYLLLKHDALLLYTSSPKKGKRINLRYEFTKLRGSIQKDQSENGQLIFLTQLPAQDCVFLCCTYGTGIKCNQ